MPSTFRSNDTNVSDILRSIKEGRCQLPEFQRNWVWDDNRIKALIASIASNHPMGALMFLSYDPNKIKFKYRPFTGAEKANNPEVLVLDGQQRLTSIFCAMFCQEAVEAKTEKKQDIKRFYYIDINKCLADETDMEEAVLSIPEDKIIRSEMGRKIDLDLSSPENEFKNHIFPLKIAYDFLACNHWRNEYQKFHLYSADILQRYAMFEAGVLRAIQVYKVPVITLDRNTPKHAVCQVFENVNTGGVSLNVFELVTATYAADNFDLRDDWEKRSKGFIAKTTMPGASSREAMLSIVSSSDFLTAATLFSQYANSKILSCKRKDVLELPLAAYTECADTLSDGFIAAANFLREQRIFSTRDLPYSTQIVPMAVIFTLLKNRIDEGTIREKLAKWYWNGVLGEMYGGSIETRYAYDVSGVVSWIDGGNEPDTVERAYFNPQRLFSLQTRLSAAYKGIMALILQGNARDFVSGKAMDFTVFSDENIDIHHIFPKSYCEKQELPRNKWNSIINKTPISAHSNRIIGSHAPSKYLALISEKKGLVEPKQLEENLSSHLIDVEAMRKDDFDTFFDNRRKALLGIIGKAMGKNIVEQGDSADIPNDVDIIDEE